MNVVNPSFTLEIQHEAASVFGTFLLAAHFRNLSCGSSVGVYFRDFACGGRSGRGGGVLKGGGVSFLICGGQNPKILCNFGG